MLTQDQFTRMQNHLPMLRTADAALAREFQEKAFAVRIPAGKDVFIEGSEVNAIALLLSGVVRVYKVGENGREITLYRFGIGQSCVLTANAILSEQNFSAIATVEQDAEAVMIHADVFRGWVRRHDAWLRFVLDLLYQRLATVMEIIEDVAFQRMDIRVAVLLLERAKTRHPVEITHQEIAGELGSSREVISRILEGFTRQGLVQLGRGTIHLLDVDKLEQLVGA